MNKLTFLISILIISSTALHSLCDAYGEDHNTYVDSILNSAEGFFISLRDGEYKKAWDLLSEKSRQTIVNDIYKTSGDQGSELKKEDIIKDFNNEGIICINYWKSFLNSFNPDIVLNDRVWEMEETGPDRAVILLKKRAVTKLRMYKENEQWRVGLVETFWIRKPLKIVEYMHSLFSGR